MNTIFKNKVYAGLLGKAIGVYLGRPVEGWTYDAIKKRYGEIWHYVNKDLGIPLIVADDDLSGTSTFFRAMEDNGYSLSLTAEDIGNSWLNYIIDDRTILWWGGKGNSTEHTAYLNLKNGIKAPESGSIKRNGRVMATQIGSQIFMEEYALMCPGDPERAVSLVDKAVSVSHDGIAKEGACFLAALETLAFTERDNQKIFREGKRFISSSELMRLVETVEDITAKESDWRKIKEYIDSLYGYDKFLGPCPFETNHAMVLAGILYGKDDFARSVMYGASAAWDTDCNAGNIGMYNGIRLGLEGLNVGADYITPVADRLIVVSADGGECFTTITQEARKVVDAYNAVNGEKKEFRYRFEFEYPYSLQGFQPCPYVADNHSETALISNSDGEGLTIAFSTLAKGTPFSLSTPTFFDVKEDFNAYEMYGSPSLYETQSVEYEIKSDGSPISVEPYVWYTDRDNALKRVAGTRYELKDGLNRDVWQIPSLGGMPVLRFGFSFYAEKRVTGKVQVKYVSWDNAPRSFEQKGSMMRDMWDLSPFWKRMFVPSARTFTPNLNHTYVISHPEENGVSTVGTRDWKDYSIESDLSFSLHASGGLVARARGHRRYYAALLEGWNRAKIIRRIDDDISVLAECEFPYGEFEKVRVKFSVCGDELKLFARGELLLTAIDGDSRLHSGGAGFVVNCGSMFIDDMFIRSCAL